MNTTHPTRTDTLAVRLERLAPGSASNFGHDLAVFGMFRDGAFRTATGNRAASMLMEHGMDFRAAEALLGIVADQDVAFDVRNGTTVLL